MRWLKAPACLRWWTRLLARARFARDYDCVGPAFGAGPAVSRTGSSSAAGEASARQRAASIVPLTLELTAEARQLIISGPNTGGKTVTLKTTALLAMMAQAGFRFRLRAREFPVFTAFLADIGDAQSIEAELSTFSAHIVNLNRLSQLAGPDSLVLLDELGSATDPEEGSALAVAVAAHFLECRRMDADLYAPHFAQGVWGEHAGRVECGRGCG